MPRAATTVLGLIVLGIGSRLLPHYPNMTAIGAIALKSRAEFGMWGLLIPLVSMTLSDLIIGFYDWRLLISVYASYVLVSILGRFTQHARWIKNTGVAILGSLIFFFITNTTVWALSTWYPHTASGLLLCLVAGLPFLAPMIAGDVLFTSLLFRKTVPNPAPARSALGASA